MHLRQDSREKRSYAPRYSISLFTSIIQVSRVMFPKTSAYNILACTGQRGVFVMPCQSIKGQWVRSRLTSLSPCDMARRPPHRVAVTRMQVFYDIQTWRTLTLTD